MHFRSTIVSIGCLGHSSFGTFPPLSNLQSHTMCLEMHRSILPPPDARSLSVVMSPSFTPVPTEVPAFSYPLPSSTLVDYSAVSHLLSLPGCIDNGGKISSAVVAPPHTSTKRCNYIYQGMFSRRHPSPVSPSTLMVMDPLK